jgi:hypothetical protein
MRKVAEFCGLVCGWLELLGVTAPGIFFFFLKIWPQKHIFRTRLFLPTTVQLTSGPSSGSPASHYPQNVKRSLTCGPSAMSPRLAAALPLPPPLPAAAAAASRRLSFLRPLRAPSGATFSAASWSPRRRGVLVCFLRLLCSHHSSAAAAAEAEAVEEARRGRKQLGMTPPLYDYLLANVREHPVRHPHSPISASRSRSFRPNSRSAIRP